METNSLIIGKNIKRYRLINDIRQEDMAERIGVSRATLINYEKGHTAINIDVLERFKIIYPDFEFDTKEKSKPRIIDDGIIDFSVLFKVLYSARNFIFIFTFLSMFFGAGSSFLLKKYYKAEISLYPAKGDTMQGLGQLQSLASNLGINSSKKDQDFNIPDVVKSRMIAKRVVNQEWKLSNNNSIYLATLWGLDRPVLYDFFKNSKIDTLVMLEKAIKKLNEHIKVSEDRISGLIKINTTFQDPKIAASVANFIGNQVQIYIQKENSAQSKKEKFFISERLLIVKSELKSSEKELKEFKERNRGYEESPELFMAFSQFFREVEAKKQVYLMLQQQLELARIEEVKQSPILHILDHAVPPINKSSPQRMIFLFISGILGLTFSCLRVIFRY